MKTEPPPPTRQPYFHAGFNHLCCEVEEIDSLRQRLTEAGYPARNVPKEPFRKRIYADDLLGNEWEFVEYFSQDPAKKNQYL